MIAFRNNKNCIIFLNNLQSSKQLHVLPGEPGQAVHVLGRPHLQEQDEALAPGAKKERTGPRLQQGDVQGGQDHDEVHPLHPEHRVCCCHGTQHHARAAVRSGVPLGRKQAVSP